MNALGFCSPGLLQCLKCTVFFPSSCVFLLPCCISYLWMLWQITKLLLKTTEIYFHISGDRSPKSRCQQGHASSRGCKTSSSFLWLLTFLGFMLTPLSPWSHCLLFFCLSNLPYVSPVRILVTGFRIHPDNPRWSLDLEILNLITSVKTLSK